MYTNVITIIALVGGDGKQLRSEVLLRRLSEGVSMKVGNVPKADIAYL